MPVRFDLFVIFSMTFPPNVSVTAVLTTETGFEPASIPSLPRVYRFVPSATPNVYFPNVPSQVLALIPVLACQHRWESDRLTSCRQKCSACTRCG